MLKIAFLGDVALIGKYDLKKNNKVTERLHCLKLKLDTFDYVVCNLEAPFTTVDKTFVCKSMHLKSHPENIRVLKYLGVSAVNLANNHIFDFGKDGLLETIEVLEKNNIEWFGVNGRSLHIDLNNNRICLSGFCSLSTNGFGYANALGDSGINTLTLDNVKSQLHKDKTNLEYSVFNIHWGIENSHYPDRNTIKIANKIMSLRESVVICGHHPHVLQGTAVYSNGYVAYSLGNCLFDDCISINGRFVVKQQEINKQGLLLELAFNDRNLQDIGIVGLRDAEHEVLIEDYNSLIASINSFMHTSTPEEYEECRKKEISEATINRIGKHDLRWLLSRLNYYSIGARIALYFRSKKYRRVLKEFD